MLIECTGRNVEISPKLRAMAEERMGRLERHLGGPVGIRVIVTHEKHRFRGEVIATYRRRRWTANEETLDARTALMKAFAKIDSQAAKDSEKRHDHKHREHNHRDNKQLDLGSLNAESGAATGTKAARPGVGGRGRKEAALPEEAARGRIVRVGRRATVAKPMTAEEAAMRIDGSREEFVVFRDSGSEKVSVLYKRRDGDFGLIVPEW